MGLRQVAEVVDLSVSANPFTQQLCTSVLCPAYSEPSVELSPCLRDSRRTVIVLWAVIVLLGALHARPRLDYAVGARALGREWEATQKSRTSLLAEYGFQECPDYHHHCHECWGSEAQVPALVLLLRLCDLMKALSLSGFQFPLTYKKGSKSTLGSKPQSPGQSLGHGRSLEMTMSFVFGGQVQPGLGT